MRPSQRQPPRINKTNEIRIDQVLIGLDILMAMTKRNVIANEPFLQVKIIYFFNTKMS
jgi:hypothetical protein